MLKWVLMSISDDLPVILALRVAGDAEDVDNRIDFLEKPSPAWEAASGLIKMHESTDLEE